MQGTGPMFASIHKAVCRPLARALSGVDAGDVSMFKHGSRIPAPAAPRRERRASTSVPHCAQVGLMRTCRIEHGLIATLLFAMAACASRSKTSRHAPAPQIEDPFVCVAREFHSRGYALDTRDRAVGLVRALRLADSARTPGASMFATLEIAPTGDGGARIAVRQTGVTGFATTSESVGELRPSSAAITAALQATQDADAVAARCREPHDEARTL